MLDGFRQAAPARALAIAVSLLAVMLVASCVGPRQQAKSGDCRIGAVALDGDFEAAGFADCRRIGAADFRLTIAPEAAPPINCSPWYAFRLRNRAAVPVRVRVRLDYAACDHRYPPKVSSDGLAWSDSLAATTVSDDDHHAIELEVHTPELFVAAQEIVAGDHYAKRLKDWTARNNVSGRVIGRSVDGRPITALSVAALPGAGREQVVLLGRQHPPEVSGALAMDAFVETLLSDHPTARAYRARFETTIVPLLNPDGVARGHWRHNAGGKDLNRDWTSFSQPETAAVQRLLTDMNNGSNRRLRLLVDFHSTRRDLFYTIPDALPTDPPLIAARWMAKLQDRMPGYNVHRVSEHNPGLPTAKTRTYERYGIPTVTFEVGDNTDRDLVARLGREGALAMMETMLASEPPPAP